MQKKLVKGLALGLSTVLVVGCSGGGAATTSTSGDGAEKPEEIKVMIWDRGEAAPGTTPENNALTEYIQEAMLEEHNVKVNFQPVTRSGSDDQLNVMMAGGNAPDVVFTYEKSLFEDYVVKGGIVDLAPYVEEFGPNLQKELEGTLEVGYVNGGQYAIPARRGLQRAKHGGYIRKDWLDELGMEVPTTKQELIDVLYAFQEHDPGNKGNSLVPWAMGGNQDSEKFYLNFVSSYARTGEEKDEYVYSDTTHAFAPGTEEGFRILNQLYNDGIITPDFAVDTADDRMKQDIANGNAGFFYDDSMRYIDLVGQAMTNDPGALYVPVNAFEDENGEYRNPADPLYGMYIMVPKTSEDKAGAVVKYLDWLAYTENAMKVLYSPDVTTDELGLPSSFTQAELHSEGYPSNLPDYAIVTHAMEYENDRDAVVELWGRQNKHNGDYPEGYFGQVYDVVTADLYTYPVVSEILAEEARYMPSVSKLMIEAAYKIISAPIDQFDSVYATEYAKLEQAGLKQILEARENYYNEQVAK